MSKLRFLRARSLRILFLIIIILSTICFPGCSNTKMKDNDQKVVSQIAKTQTPAKTDEKKIQKDSTQKPDIPEQCSSKIEEIKSKLKKTDIYAVTVSYDNNYVAYVQGDKQLMEGQLFLWKVGDNNPKIVDGVNDRICELYWSPNSQYLFVDIGTSAQRAGIIVSASENKELYGIGYIGGPLWSLDSKYVAIGMVSKIQPVTPTELDGVRDLVLYDICTQQKKIIAHATSEYDFIPRQWDKDGTLHYDKHYYIEKPMEKLTYVYR